MNYFNDELWNRISAFKIDDETSIYKFSDKLAKENNWSTEFTQLAINEYKRFIYLCCISPKGASPSPIIDIVWHLHLTYTTNYWKDFCINVLKREIHHFPSKGGNEENLKHEDWYKDTIALYELTFGTLPPNEIWNFPQRITLQENRINNIRDTELENLEYMENAVSIPSSIKILDVIALSIPIIFLLLANHKLNPYNLTGKEFLVFYSILGVSLLSLAYYKSRQFRKKYTALIKDQIPNDLTVFELAFLKGGEQRLVQTSILDLIENNAIYHIGKGVFEVTSANAFNTSKKYNPISKNLEIHQKNDLLEYQHFVNASKKSMIEIDTKLKSIENKINLNNSINYLFYIVGAVGIVRLIQGIYNEKPVLYLILLIVLFVVITLFLYSYGKKDYIFNEVVEDMYRHTHANEVNIFYSSALLERFIWSGYACMIGAHSYNELNYFFERKSKKNESSCSSCSNGGCGSSCSSSDGGGDGGGCGGCGGGD